MDVRLIVLSVSVVTVVLLYKNSGLARELEADCDAPQSSATIPEISSTFPEFLFRTDRVTTEECLTFKKWIPCTPVRRQPNCYHVPTYDDELFYARSKTYLVIECSERGRADMAQLARNVSGESPNRAIVLILHERNGTDDPVHADVFEPLRNQVTDFTVKCASNITTNKLYDIGVLPNLFRLVLKSCRNLTIRKQDFTRLPRIVVISFERSTIEAMQRGTFSNLPTLQNLQLELGVSWQIIELRRHLLRFSFEEHRHSDLEFREWDVEKVHRLHCDCSFAWFRNFIKERPELFVRRSEGEVFIVGNYLSPLAHDLYLHDHMQLLSVDCMGNLTASNMDAGSAFSYNTSCHTC